LKPLRRTSSSNRYEAKSKESTQARTSWCVLLPGVGEIAATLAGRGSLNQPLSGGDLLRERVTNNIGQASDQTVANLVLTEHIIASVPADTEIYVILQKPVRQLVQQSQTQP